MADKDTPSVDLVLADLEKELHAPKPYTVVLPTGKRVVFKDPFDFNMDERHEIAGLMNDARAGVRDDYDFLERIMSSEDFQKYKDANLKIRSHNALMTRVMAHFEGVTGE